MKSRLVTIKMTVTRQRQGQKAERIDVLIEPENLTQAGADEEMLDENRPLLQAIANAIHIIEPGFLHGPGEGEAIALEQAKDVPPKRLN